MPTYDSYDPITGELTFTYTTTNDSRPFVISATDYDTERVQPWRSHAVEYGIHSSLAGTYLRSEMTIFDDGSSFSFRNVDVFILANTWVDGGDITTRRDAAGRVDYIRDVRDVFDWRNDPPDYRSRDEDWDTATGKLDFRRTTYRSDGRVEDVDYDTATGNADFIVVTYRDGSRLTQDIDPATGRVDYERRVEASGARVDTDHDLTDAHPWNTFTVSYAADGRVLDVIFG